MKAVLIANGMSGGRPMAIQIPVTWVAFKMNIVAGYPAPLDVANTGGSLSANIAMVNGTHRLLRLNQLR